MNISYLDLIDPILIDENTVNVLVIENKQLFRNVINDLALAVAGNDSRWVLSEAGKVLSLNKAVSFIPNPLQIDLNEKKLLEGLYSELSNIMVEDTHFVETANIISMLNAYVDRALNEIEYPFLGAADMTVQSLFKLANVRFESYSNDDLDRLANYVQLCSRFKKSRLAVFINLKTYFSDEELELLYKDMQYKKLPVLLLENRESKLLENESLTIIDNDICFVRR